MFSKKTVVLAKIETESGTDSVPTAASNAVEVFDASLEVKPDMRQRNPGNSDRSMHAEIRGGTSVELKFSAYIKGSGTAGTAPRIGALLRACDFLETIVSSTSVTYTPAISPETCSIYANFDGIYHKVLGCAGDVEVVAEAGDLALLNFTIQGVYQEPTDVVCPTPTFDTPTPLTAKNATFTIGSYAAVIKKMTLKKGNTIAKRADFNQDEGILAFMPTDRLSEGSLLIEAVLRATSNADFFDFFHAGTTKALSCVFGATAGNIVTMTAPACLFRAPKYDDNDGIRMFELSFQMARSSGNDEMNIAFT